jgi:signal transduction histidine kinase
MKQSVMEHTIERNETKGSNRVIPFAILFLFIGITVLSIIVLTTSSSKQLTSEYLCKVDKRIVRLSVIGQGDHGKYYHLASNWPSRLNTPAHKEDLEVIHNGVQVIIKETIEGKDYYDITYPLHDKEGIVLGSIGYTATSKTHLDWLQIGVYFGSSILLFIMVIINFRGRENRILWLLSEQKKHEQFVLESSKQQEELKRLKSLKTMAGAIAHRFNNAMMAVQGNLELMTETLPADSDELKMASRAAQAARGVSQIGSMMLSYVGQKNLHLQELSIVDLVKESISAFKSALPPTVTLNFTPPSQPLYCSIEQQQIKEVVGNILTNALESLTDNTGTIDITFGNEYFTTDSFPIPFQNDKIQDGIYTFCQIKDSGHGINSKALSQIFDPFYTTKFVGRGLGLALTVGIMQTHHGAIAIKSSLDKGTTVKILLPSISFPQ